MSQTSTLTLPIKESTLSLNPGPSTLPLTPKNNQENDSNSVTTTLRSLYFRAARAFLQRDINLTLTLISSALPLIPSPHFLNDSWSVWRKKWDILRITLETTVYATPPADPESLPSSLRANLMLSPQSLLAGLHTRSLMWFTPVLLDSETRGALSIAYVPTQVLITLALASMKLGVADVGRSIIEDWLARRDVNQDADSEVKEGYVKVTELYCLHILPKLNEWEYATEFLQYEGQLDSVKRYRLMTSLETLRSKTADDQQQQLGSPSTSSLSPQSELFSRSPSPAGSSASSSSELTATPLTPRYDAQDPKGKRRDVPASLTSISGPASVCNSANTSRTATPMPNQVVTRPKYKQKQRHLGTRAPVLDPPAESSSVREPSTVTAIKSTFATVKSYLTRLNLTTILVITITLLSLIQLRRSRRKSQITSGTGANTPTSALNKYTLSVNKKSDGSEEVKLFGTTAGSAVDEVRKKLASSGGSNGSTRLLALLWNEAVKVVGDTVRMGGRGLV